MVRDRGHAGPLINSTARGYMRCTDPNLIFFDERQNRKFIKEKFFKRSYGTAIQKLPCKKCPNCRTDIAQGKALRVYHEQSLYPDNIFCMLSYADNENTELEYEHMQKFKMSVREYVARTRPENPYVTFFHVGEYGEKNNRKHWHCIIFNWKPDDYREYKKSGEHQLYISERLDKLWKHGFANFGSVTFESGYYVALYQQKDSECPPITKGMPTRPALGIKWLEKNYQQVFQQGFCWYKDQKRPIPGSYVRWLKNLAENSYHHSEIYEDFKRRFNYDLVYEEELENEELEYQQRVTHAYEFHLQKPKRKSELAHDVCLYDLQNKQKGSL